MLLLILAIALAAGGGHINIGGGSSSASGQSTPGDPCRGQPGSTIIGSWGNAYLRCERWRHILDRHALQPGATPQDVLTCIENVFSNGTDIGNNGRATTRLRWSYKDAWADVILNPDGSIHTAYTEGRPGNDWAGCAEG